METKVQGPASYFPAIEAKYGRSIDEWKTLMRDSGLTSHKELVEWLKTEHGFGHGHASAITLHFRAEGSPPETTGGGVGKLFAGKKAHWQPAYDKLATAMEGFGGVKVVPKNNAVGFAVKSQFAMLVPTAQRLDVGLKLPDVPATDRLADAGKWQGTMMTHRVQLTDPDQVDKELLGWLRQAYDAQP